MKKLFFAVAAAAALLLPMSAHAAEKTGFYVAPKFVLSIQHSDAGFEHGYLTESNFNTSMTQTNAGGALAVGYDFSKKFDLPVRAEIEYGIYGSVSKKSPTISRQASELEVGIKTLLLNIYADLFNWNGFTPYVGAGIGFAFVENKCDFNKYPPYSNGFNYSFSHTKRTLAGQIGLGCAYAFNETVSLDFGYRFLMIDGENSHSSLNKKPLDVPYYFRGDWEMANTMKSKNNYIHQFMLGLRVTF